jgi:hypothetical protein
MPAPPRDDLHSRWKCAPTAAFLPSSAGVVVCRVKELWSCSESVRFATCVLACGARMKAFRSFPAVETAGYYQSSPCGDSGWRESVWEEFADAARKIKYRDPSTRPQSLRSFVLAQDDKSFKVLMEQEGAHCGRLSLPNHQAIKCRRRSSATSLRRVCGAHQQSLPSIIH